MKQTSTFQCYPGGYGCLLSIVLEKVYCSLLIHFCIFFTFFSYYFPLQKSVNTEKFYDALAVCKGKYIVVPSVYVIFSIRNVLFTGPSLGTSYTLVCPYVMLAHYDELEWASVYGLNPNIIRISVGLEDIEELKNIFSVAFEVVTSFFNG